LDFYSRVLKSYGIGHAGTVGYNSGRLVSALGIKRCSLTRNSLDELNIRTKKIN